MARSEVKKEVKGNDVELSPGMKVRAQYAEDGKFYEATIDKVLSAGRVYVTYIEYGNSEEIDAAQVLVDAATAKMKKRYVTSSLCLFSTHHYHSSRSLISSIVLSELDGMMYVCVVYM
jgi:hypothetical protein